MKTRTETIKKITLSNGEIYHNPDVVTGIKGISKDFIVIKNYQEGNTIAYINKRHIVEILTTTGDVEADEFICQVLQ